jgi:hypothetical protein
VAPTAPIRREYADAPDTSSVSGRAFTLFGLEPLGYHIANALMITILTGFLYGVLRELGLSRSIAIAVAAAYSLIPNYSTDRFWFGGLRLHVDHGLPPPQPVCRPSGGSQPVTEPAGVEARCPSGIAGRQSLLRGRNSTFAAQRGTDLVACPSSARCRVFWAVGRWGAILFLGSNIFMIAALLVYQGSGVS